MNRPPLFIGCSTEGIKIARAIQELLVEDFEVEIWNQGVFGLTKGNIDNLIEIGNKFKFGVFVLTPDDVVISRGESTSSPRDNVIFEIGFFLGKIGRERTFIVHELSSDIKIPSDLAGISCATYQPPTAIGLTAALGSACNKITRAAKEAVESEIISSPKTPKDEWVDALVRSALNVVCRAITSPAGLDVAKLRAFIFKKEGEELICSHYWAPNPVQEPVDVLRFPLNPQTRQQVAVVEAAMSKSVCAKSIGPLTEEVKKDIYGHDKIKKDLCFVVAAPIISPNGGDIWGTVNIDTSTIEGVEMLNQEMSKNVIFELGKHLLLALTN